MLEIVAHDDQLRDTSLVLDLELYHGAVRDNQETTNCGIILHRSRVSISSNGSTREHLAQAVDGGSSPTNRIPSKDFLWQSIYLPFVCQKILSFMQGPKHRSSLSLHKRKSPWGWDHNGAYQDRGADCRHSHKKSQQSKVREVSRGARHGLQDNIEKKFALRGGVERSQGNLLQCSTLCKSKIITME